MDDQQFLETWEIHNRINLYLLDAVEPASLLSLSASKGRTVGEQFAHVHNVRLMWLKSAAPDLLAGLMKIEKDQAPDKKLLRENLTKSGEAIKPVDCLRALKDHSDVIQQLRRQGLIRG